MPPPDDNARKLLLVSYWYPPGVGAAAERMHSFARYLPEHGWEVHVLTAVRSGSIPQDRGVVVHSVTDPLARSSSGFADYDPRRRPSRWKTWLREWTFPDRFIAWRRAAFREGQAILERERIDLILASFPPASVVDLGLRLHKSSERPLVLDFRDRWLGPGGYEPRSERGRRKHLELEQQCIASATAITTVSEAMADAIAAEQKFSRERIFVVPNGFEEGEPIRFRWSAEAPAAALTIAHIGTVIPRNRPELFFQSVAELHRSGALTGVTFDFVGNLSRNYLTSIGVADIVRTTGLVSREEARRRMTEADALLLLTGEYVGRWGYNAKVFEYIRSGRPILCLEERPVSNDRLLLEEFAAERSSFALLADAAGMRTGIDAIREWLAKNRESQPCLPSFDGYSRRHLAARLASHLSALVL